MKRWGTAAALTLALSSVIFAQERDEPKTASSGSGESAPEMPGWMWINFAILAAGLGYFTAKTAPALLRARDEEIRQGIDEAARQKLAAEAQAAEIERHVAALGGHIEALRENIQKEMSEEAERLKQETERLIQRIMEQAQQEIGFMTKTASAHLQAYFAELALDLAGRRIQQNMNPQTQRELVNRFINGLGPRPEN